MRASRSNRSAKPFLPPLTFFVMVSASPSSAQRLSRGCPSRTRAPFPLTASGSLASRAIETGRAD